MSNEKKTFEEAMNRLQVIVHDLEVNQKPLDETIQLFEEGLNLVKDCDEQLKQFDLKVEEITRRNGGQ